MTSPRDFVEIVQQITGAALLQETPYPVVAPTTVEAAAQCVRAAREQRFSVLVLGSGSSFPPDFHVLRENLLALMTIRLTGAQRVSAFQHARAGGNAGRGGGAWSQRVYPENRGRFAGWHTGSGGGRGAASALGTGNGAGSDFGLR